VNPHNFHPVFTHEQIAASLQATILTTLTLCAAMILDQNQLHSNILVALPSDSSISDHLLYLEKRWSKDDTGFLRLDNRIYVLDNAVMLMGDQREFDLETRVTTNRNNKTPRCFTVVH